MDSSRPIRSESLIAAILLLLGSSAIALADSVEISGVDGALRANVVAFVTLDDLDPSYSHRSAAHRNLMRRTSQQVRKALEGFGYYDPVIQVQLSSNPETAHRISIDPGPRVTIRGVHVEFLDVDDGVTLRKRTADEQA